jgi:hypothetical protein
MGGSPQNCRSRLDPGTRQNTGAVLTLWTDFHGPLDDRDAAGEWVEHGKAPASILGTVTNPTTNAVTLSRPLCAYPLSARYTGHGSTDEAKNFVGPRQD